MSKNFEALLKELGDVATESDTMAKAIPAEPEVNPEDDEDGADDAAIAAAAEAGGAAPAAAAPGDDDKPAFGKSFEFVDAAGAKHEAVDATDLVKSLIDRLDSSDDVLAKALTSMAGSLKAQGDLIKSLTSQVQTLSSQGRGRKAMLTVSEKPAVGDTLAKSQAEQGVTPEQFFAKANTAFDAGKISGKELNVISVCLRGNHPIEPSLIQKIALA
jgi:hypothetical protein